MRTLSPARPSRPQAVTTRDPPWLKALFLAPAVVGSFAARVVLSRTRGVRAGLRRWLGREPGGDLDALRASVLGQGKRRVTALFGPPPAATSAPTDTWYYPVATAERTAMAISFEDDRAARVEFFRSPG
jgi:hypothetical protein